ncbi:MAG: hypothetical protein RIS35_104 [Pseudomonadota bacterium]
MFDFSPGEDLELAVETARRFADAVLAPQQRAHEAARGVPPEVRAQAREIGLDRIDWPESAGGAGLGALARAVVLETLGGGDPGAAIALDPLGPVAHALCAFGGPDLLAEHAQALDALPGARAVLVVDEPRGLRETDGRLTGVVPWVPSDRVDLLALLTREGLTLVREDLVVEPLPGSGLGAAGAAQLRLDGAPVLASWTDPAAAARALAHARLDAAALMVGQMTRAADDSRRYALDRVAFGKPIAHHQALAFLIVDMRVAVDGAREMVREAAWRLQSGLPYASAAAAAFLEAIDAGLFVGPNAVQILGAAGFMRDHPFEKAMRELRALGLLAGGADLARDDAWVDEPWADGEAITGDVGREGYGERPINLLAAEG